MTSIKRDSTASDDTPVKNLLNLGPKCETWLHPVGIRTLGDLKRMPLEELYESVKRRTPQCNAVFLYAIFGALTNTHWNLIPPDVKQQLLGIAQNIDQKLKSEPKGAIPIY